MEAESMGGILGTLDMYEHIVDIGGVPSTVFLLLWQEGSSPLGTSDVCSVNWMLIYSRFTPRFLGWAPGADCRGFPDARAWWHPILNLHASPLSRERERVEPASILGRHSQTWETRYFHHFPELHGLMILKVMFYYVTWFVCMCEHACMRLSTIRWQLAGNGSLFPLSKSYGFKSGRVWQQAP